MSVPCARKNWKPDLAAFSMRFDSARTRRNCGETDREDSPARGNVGFFHWPQSFFSSSATNWTLVPMITWTAFFPGRMTPRAPAERMTVSFTFSRSCTSRRSRVMQLSTDRIFSGPPRPWRSGRSCRNSATCAHTSRAKTGSRFHGQSCARATHGECGGALPDSRR